MFYLIIIISCVITQAIKFLHTEGKKDKTTLHFVAGGRVMLQFGVLLDREKQLSALLK
jgi:hypothetical protein